jgi:hypothetical protein
MKNKILLVFLIPFLMFSCVIPEKFSCEINVKNDSTYSVSFNGTLLFWMALKEINEKGKVSKETDDQIKALFDEWAATDSTIKNYQYQGNGRAFIEYLQIITDKTSLDLNKIFGLPLNINVEDDNSITINESGVDSDAYSEFFTLGYQINGTINIVSEIPIQESGDNRIERQGNKYIIRQTFLTFPENDVIIIIKK